MSECIFCKIANGTIPVQKIYEDEHVVAFNDASPAAPVHILLIPRKHIESILAVAEEDLFLMSHMVKVVQNIAEQVGVDKDGFRLVINTKENGGQTVFHLHWHLLGGRPLQWPPG